MKIVLVDATAEHHKEKDKQREGQTNLWRKQNIFGAIIGKFTDDKRGDSKHTCKEPRRNENKRT